MEEETELDPDARFAEFEGSVEINGVRLPPHAVQELKAIMHRFGYGSLTSIPFYLLRKAQARCGNGKLIEDPHARDLEDAMEYTLDEQNADHSIEDGDDDHDSPDHHAHDAAYTLGGSRPIITGMQVFGTVRVQPYGPEIAKGKGSPLGFLQAA